MPPTRRSHKKSRKGCTECKHRHIRCDERKPSCVNCEAAERICSFLSPKTGEQQQSGRSTPNDTHPALHSRDNLTVAFSRVSVPRADAVPSISASTLSPANCCPGLSDSVPTTDFTLQHMILLHHARTVPNLVAFDRNAIDIALRHGTHAPYLLDEVLAFTAFHMANVYPGSTVLLLRLSTELQTRALASFTRLTETVATNDHETAVPRFLFSAILGRHALADALTHCRSDFNFFIDRFVECVELNRGIRAVIPSARDYLHNSDIQPFLNNVLEAERKIISPGQDCDALCRLMDDSDLNEISVKSCRQAIEVLQWSFDLCHNLEKDDYPQSASAFSVRIGAGFMDVLRKHRPEALAILAYYGVLLYRCRTFAAFSDAGAAMIHALSGQLGSYWKDVLTWPLHVLETE